MSLLSVADLKVSFGGVAAVDGVSFEVEAGTLLGLIGPNGAGKTTTVEAVTGFAPLAAGTSASTATPSRDGHRTVGRGPGSFDPSSRWSSSTT